MINPWKTELIGETLLPSPPVLTDGAPDALKMNISAAKHGINIRKNDKLSEMLPVGQQRLIQRLSGKGGIAV